MATLDRIWLKIQTFAGTCSASADIEDIKAAAQTAQERIDQAIIGGKFLQSDSRVFEKINKANEALGKVLETLGKVEEICLDVQAIARIHGAVKILKDESVIYKDWETAAKAFGQLFVGFGRLCRHLPSPAKEYGQFFEAAGDFFVNVGRGLQPEKVGGYRDVWNQIDWEYAGGRPR